MGLGFVILIGTLAAIFVLGIRILAEYERGVVFRLGRFNGNKSAGFRWLIPGVDRMVRISLREIVMDVPAQEVITRDNVSLKVNAVLYFRVLHPEKAVIQVENYLYGTSQLAQTTLRSVCGQAELDELLAERESINQRLQEIIDQQTEPWGVKVRAVEVKQIDLPPEMQRAMAKQAEAEREKRSKVIHAEGEFQAAQRLAEAAKVLATQESALQLRYLQTLAEIATENNSTIIFPVPIDIFRPFYEMRRRSAAGTARRRWRATIASSGPRNACAARWRARSGTRCSCSCCWRSRPAGPGSASTSSAPARRRSSCGSGATSTPWATPGLQWHLPPPLETHEIVNVNEVVREEFGARGKAEGAAADEARAEASMQTSDNNIVQLGFVGAVHGEGRLRGALPRSRIRAPRCATRRRPPCARWSAA